eukprot:TRINITY_DN7157_c0_g2_i10.p1 TRINITY_DN7157_c0_g2~~TRINITY_DN7157_c0_g2_i10.p1  ORF type:complete len:267 (+),score=-24.77 TRINITY_DN7157_c0_g2_i10:436-1236(+)
MKERLFETQTVSISIPTNKIKQNKIRKFSTPMHESKQPNLRQSIDCTMLYNDRDSLQQVKNIPKQPTMQQRLSKYNLLIQFITQRLTFCLPAIIQIASQVNIQMHLECEISNHLVNRRLFQFIRLILKHFKIYNILTITFKKMYYYYIFLNKIFSQRFQLLQLQLYFFQIGTSFLKIIVSNHYSCSYKLTTIVYLHIIEQRNGLKSLIHNVVNYYPGRYFTKKECDLFLVVQMQYLQSYLHIKYENVQKAFLILQYFKKTLFYKYI